MVLFTLPVPANGDCPLISGWGNIQLKGPLPENGMGSVEGLTKSALGALNNPSAGVDTVVVDLARLTESQKASVRQAISEGASQSSIRLEYID